MRGRRECRRMSRTWRPIDPSSVTHDIAIAIQEGADVLELQDKCLEQKDEKSDETRSRRCSGTHVRLTLLSDAAFTTVSHLRTHPS